MEHKPKYTLFKAVFQSLYVFMCLWGTEKIFISTILLMSLLTAWSDFTQCVLPGNFIFPQSFVISIIVYKSSHSNTLIHLPVNVPIVTSSLCCTRAHTMSESILQHSYWSWANQQRKATLAMQLHSRRLLNKLSTEFRISARLQLLCQINVCTMSSY